jgi:hypothetical protein
MSTVEPLPPHLERLGRDLVRAATDLQRPRARTLMPWPWRTSRSLIRGRFALPFALAGLVVAVAALVPNLGGSGLAPAFAGPLVRFAQASPRVLLPLPGWHVVDANEEASGMGEIDFVKGSTTARSRVLDLPAGASLNRPRSVTGRIAALTWYRTPEGGLVQGRKVSIPTGLGVRVTRLFVEGKGRSYLDLSAFLSDAGLEMRFRATVRNMAMFRQELLAIRTVDVTTFLKAMPSYVITSISATGDAPKTIRKMLHGIPLPPGFTTAKIKNPNLIRDRYQLGAAVTGTVACIWIRDWNHARIDGDTAAANRAITAMSTAPHWPILVQMAKQGGWPSVLDAFATAMKQGTWYGRSLVSNANTGLGCPALGVKLGPTR